MTRIHRDAGRQFMRIAAVLFIVIGVVAAGPITMGVWAEPRAQLGPAETFAGRVVPGTITPLLDGVRFNIERPVLSNPNELEQVTIELAGPAGPVRPNENLTITGNYDVGSKIFKASSVASLGNAGPTEASKSDTKNGGDDEGNDNRARKNRGNSHNENDNS